MILALLSSHQVTIRMEGPRAKLMSLHEKLAGLKVEKNDLEDKLELEAAKWEEQEQDVLAMREELERLKQDQKGVQGQLKQETLHKNGQSQEARLLREQVEEVRSEDSGEVERREQQRKLNMKRLEQERKQVDDQIEQEGVVRETADTKIKEIAVTEQKVAQAIKSKQEQETALKKEIKEMEGAGEAHLAVFGIKIPLVEKAVQRNIQRFQRPPIGELSYTP